VRKNAACASTLPRRRLTSGAYRYKTRPWEEARRHHLHRIAAMVARQRWACGLDTGTQIVRGDNRDKSGIKNDFLCIRGLRFDFADHAERLTQPLIRRMAP